MHQRSRLSRVGVEPLSDCLHGNIFPGECTVGYETPPNGVIAVSVRSRIPNTNRRAVGQPDDARSLDVEEEGIDRIVYPQQNIGAALECTGVDLRTGICWLELAAHNTANDALALETIAEVA